MIEPKLPINEDTRLETLRALQILDSVPEERFDRLTRMAKRMFGVPISLVSLIDDDRQWFKSKRGLEADQTPRTVSFCGHTILGDEPFIVPDALKDERFKNNPLVLGEPNIRFYAGCPLRMSNGSKLATLCLIDNEPRELEQEDLQLLQDLATMAEQEIAAVQLATLDELTMISNRRGFTTLGEHALHVCRRKNWPVTFLLFDLNEFKLINDQFGHAEGDRALISFANVMRRSFRDSDVFARVGGDEFATLLTDTDESAVTLILERFASQIESLNQTEKRGYNIRYSVGSVSRPPGSVISIDAMKAEADARMYEGKRDATR